MLTDWLTDWLTNERTLRLTGLLSQPKKFMWFYKHFLNLIIIIYLFSTNWDCARAGVRARRAAACRCGPRSAARTASPTPTRAARPAPGRTSAAPDPAPAPSEISTLIYSRCTYLLSTIYSGRKLQAFTTLENSKTKSNKKWKLHKVGWGTIKYFSNKIVITIYYLSSTVYTASAWESRILDIHTEEEKLKIEPRQSMVWEHKT